MLSSERASSHALGRPCRRPTTVCESSSAWTRYAIPDAIRRSAPSGIPVASKEGPIISFPAHLPGLIPMATKSNGRKTKDAITLLEEDHATVRKLLSELEKATRSVKKREDLLTRIAQEVRVHAALEEEIFYPAFHAAVRTKEDGKLFYEATEEHGLVDLVLPALEETDPSTEEFAAKAKVLKDLIEHHAEEEEKEMLPRSRKLLGRERLVELGEELEQRKEELKGSVSLGERRGQRTRPISRLGVR